MAAPKPIDESSPHANLLAKCEEALDRADLPLAQVALRTSINLLLADANSGQPMDGDVHAAVRALAVRVARASRDPSWLEQIEELARQGRAKG